MNKYTFIDAQKANFPARALCRALSVPESSYYDWHTSGRARRRERDVAKSELVAAIRHVHDDSDQTYGSPRIHDGLRKNGVVVSSCRRVVAAGRGNDG